MKKLWLLSIFLVLIVNVGYAGELGSGSGTSYPTALDADSSPEVNHPASNATTPNANTPNDLADAVIAVQTELGTDPAGSLTDVDARLDVALEEDGTIKDDAVPGEGLLLDNEVQGAIAYHNGTKWVSIAPGTSGYVLETQGAGANPVWGPDDGASAYDELWDGDSDTGIQLDEAGTDEDTIRIDVAGVEVGTIDATRYSLNLPIYIKEQADASADVAGYGQIWVNTATPNELWWTDDAGTDKQLGSGYVDRGDPAAFDKAVGDFTTDATWNDWDLSAIIDAGAKAVCIHVEVQDDAVSSKFEFRKNGTSNQISTPGMRTQVANQVIYGDMVVSCDANGVIEYYGTNTTFSSINVVITGWFF